MATRVLSVWKASAMMSHISRMCSRMSSGRPLSGRFIASDGLATARRPSPSSPRVRSTRFSTSRTLVRYSSSLAWSRG